MYAVMEHAESKLLNQSVVEESHALLEVYLTHPEQIEALLHIAHVYDYALADPTIPGFLRAIDDQLDEVTLEGVNYKVVRLVHEDRVYFFLYDYTEFNNYESQVMLFLVFGVVFAGFFVSARDLKNHRKVSHK